MVNSLEKISYNFYKNTFEFRPKSNYRNMKILKIDRGSVEIDIDGEILRVLGEAMMPLPKPELSSYVIYENSFKWKNQDYNLIINRSKIIDFLRKEFLERNLRLIIE